MRTFHVENFGCRTTQADGAALERQFQLRGLDRAAASEADLVILNTCTVTGSADQDARAAIRRVHRHNPQAKIIVTGCYAQRAPDEIASLSGVTAVIGNSHKHQLAEIALPSLTAPCRPDTDSPAFLPLSTLTANPELRAGERIFVSDIFAHTELVAAPVFEREFGAASRTRPNLKVQDGCDNRCSFCVIPSVRGNSRSLPLTQIVEEVSALIAAGYKELVISGINLGRWGRDLPAGPGPRTFEDLLQAILSGSPVERLRISSVEPMDWTDRLISLVASSPRIAKHAHVPLQSASDTVLRRMHRKYRPWHYREKIEKIYGAMPKAAIGADVMTGFPGETDAEFESTLRFIEDVPFNYLHVFTYSARPGTFAASMPNQVPVQVARERNKALRDLAADKKLSFMRSFTGQSLGAITLGPSSEMSAQAGAILQLADQTGSAESADVLASSFTEALTDNYQKLYLRGRHRPNQWITARIARVESGVFWGEIADPVSRTRG